MEEVGDGKCVIPV